jgi:gas vesicle protein
MTLQEYLMPDHRPSDPSHDELAADRGGFVALAVIAAAVGAGAALMLAPEEGARTRQRVGRGFRSLRGEASETMAQLRHEIRKRRRQSQRDRQIAAVAGLLIGAGLAALFTPESGAVTRQRLGGTLGRIKVGAVDRIERLRQRQAETGGQTEPDGSVRNVQELGRDPNTVF